MSRWTVVEHPEVDSFDLLEDGSAALYGAPQEEVERFIEDFGSSEDEIILEDFDGPLGEYRFSRPPRWRKERV